MYKRILVPVDLGDPNLAKPALDSAVMIADATGGEIRLINVLAVTPVMLAEYVPPDFDVQQRRSAEDALSIIAKEVGSEPGASPRWCGRAASITRFWRRRRRTRPTSS